MKLVPINFSRIDHIIHSHLTGGDFLLITLCLGFDSDVGFTLASTCTFMLFMHLNPKPTLTIDQYKIFWECYRAYQETLDKIRANTHTHTHTHTPTPMIYSFSCVRDNVHTQPTHWEEILHMWCDDMFRQTIYIYMLVDLQNPI